MRKQILAIDQGTTSSRALILDAAGQVRRQAQREFSQRYPQPGWVEHDPEEIWAGVLAVCREVLDGAGEVSGIGITNQRETCLLWERESGRPVTPAIVWQDRRSADICSALRHRGLEPLYRERTGLLLDPYFSATKLAWMLEHQPQLRRRAEAGELAFGTIDSFLIWRLTGGRVHATDASNASRTLLFDIHTQRWSAALLEPLEIPSVLLPEVRDSAADYGGTEPDLLGARIPICGVAGDQQAALIGQGCLRPGQDKITFGTGAFAVRNAGTTVPLPPDGLLTTVAYRLRGEACYAVEGSVFIAGAAVQWLRDALGLIGNAAETEALARSVVDAQGVYLVPAFVGLGAPHWQPGARGALFGLTRDSGPAHLARAALDAVCYQSHDLLCAMAEDGGTVALRVDGGMAANDWLMQRLADLTGRPVEVPALAETTALGAAQLARLQLGLVADTEALAAAWQAERSYRPQLPEAERRRLLAGWQRAVAAVRMLAEAD